MFHFNDDRMHFEKYMQLLEYLKSLLLKDIWANVMKHPNVMFVGMARSLPLSGARERFSLAY
jgi:hypothetical protein